MGSWRKVERSRHEAEEKDNQRKKSAPAAGRIERSWVVDRGDAQEAHAEKQDSPDIPALPETKDAQEQEKEREEGGTEPMERSAQRTKNVAAIELGDRKKIEGSSEESDPCGAANGMKQQGAGRDARMKNGSEKPKQERRAKHQVYAIEVVEAGNDFRMDDTEGESWDGEDKTDKRSGSAYIEESPSRANG